MMDNREHFTRNMVVGKKCTKAIFLISISQIAWKTKPQILRKYNNFEELECWKAATRIRKKVNELADTLSIGEEFNLFFNMKKLSRLITHTIARGFGHLNHPENTKCCRKSRGYLFELIDNYIIAAEEGYISEKVYNAHRLEIEKTLRLLNEYIGELESRDAIKSQNGNFSLPLTCNF